MKAACVQAQEGPRGAASPSRAAPLAPAFCRHPVGQGCTSAWACRRDMLLVACASVQVRVFRPAPEGVRRCIVATNVAETSITGELLGTHAAGAQRVGCVPLPREGVAQCGHALVGNCRGRGLSRWAHRQHVYCDTGFACWKASVWKFSILTAFVHSSGLLPPPPPASTQPPGPQPCSCRHGL